MKKILVVVYSVTILIILVSFFFIFRHEPSTKKSEDNFIEEMYGALEKSQDGYLWKVNSPPKNFERWKNYTFPLRIYLTQYLYGENGKEQKMIVTATYKGSLPDGTPYTCFGCPSIIGVGIFEKNEEKDWLLVNKNIYLVAEGKLGEPPSISVRNEPSGFGFDAVDMFDITFSGGEGNLDDFTLWSYSMSYRNGKWKKKDIKIDEATYAIAK